VTLKKTTSSKGILSNRPTHTQKRHCRHATAAATGAVVFFPARRFFCGRAAIVGGACVCERVYVRVCWQ
jgi:hypothetical protein